MDDYTVIEAQIGRAPRAPSQVVARCHLALPVVIEVPPLLDDGTPFPTLYWLTCPLARARVQLRKASALRRASAYSSIRTRCCTRK